jgi:YihY family inner membrane protein
VPNCRTHWKYSWLGAFTATVLFETAQEIFTWYLKNFATDSQVYGTLASVMIFLS